MAPLASYFDDYLNCISPTFQHRERFRNGQTRLRELLQRDPDLNPIIETIFLQGSNRRDTALAPQQVERPDVDVVVVTRLDAGRVTPADVLARFVPFLRKHYPGDWDQQQRSLGLIDRQHDVDLDLVVMAAPDRAGHQVLLQRPWSQDEHLLEDQTPPQESWWRVAPFLLLTDVSAAEWIKAAPLAQYDFTKRKSRTTNGHYVKVVKALKGLRSMQLAQGAFPRRPKSYPLEHLIGQCCPDGITGVAEGVVRTLEALVRRFAAEADAGRTPVLHNHGTGLDVMARVDPASFAEFIRRMERAAQIARQAYDEDDLDKSAALWRELFGNQFPLPSPRVAPVITGGRFA